MQNSDSDLLQKGKDYEKNGATISVVIDQWIKQ